MQQDLRDEGSIPLWIGWYCAALQFMFALTWTVYIIFLPKLFDQAGLPRSLLLPLLMVDQAIFAVTDLLVGIATDRVGRAFHRLAGPIVIATCISCAAFIALPLVATSGGMAQPALIGLVIVWTVTSAALRVPPVALLGKYAKQSLIPQLAGLVTLGIGLSGILAPFLTAHLRDVDPRLPFAVSSCALLLTVFGLARLGRRFKSAKSGPARSLAGGRPFGRNGGRTALFVAAILLLALGFQLHSHLNSSRLFLRFAEPAQLEFLLPVFWIGFNLAVPLTSFLTERHSGLLVSGGAALIGALALAAAVAGDQLVWLIGAQALAGAAWGGIVMSAVASALLIGGAAASGRLVGLTFSTFALAALARLSVAAAGPQISPSGTLLWLPALVWLAGGAGLILLALTLRLAWPPQPREMPS